MQVKAKKDLFIDGTLRFKDEEFDYTGPKNANVEPVEEPKKKAQQSIVEKGS